MPANSFQQLRQLSISKPKPASWLLTYRRCPIRTEDSDFSIMRRTDDIIIVAGHRVSTGAKEEVLVGHRDVAECPVIGAVDDLTE